MATTLLLQDLELLHCIPFRSLFHHVYEYIKEKCIDAWFVNYIVALSVFYHSKKNRHQLPGHTAYASCKVSPGSGEIWCSECVYMCNK
jgi:hypothetical protein